MSLVRKFYLDTLLRTTDENGLKNDAGEHGVSFILKTSSAMKEKKYVNKSMLLKLDIKFQEHLMFYHLPVQ